MLVEAIFWFHPLVWWIGTRLVDEREHACDEDVLRTFGAPQAYAEGILTVCKRYVEAPLTCVSGVSGSNLKKRIEAIMTGRIGLRLNVAKKATLAVAAVAAVALPVVVGAMKAAPILARQISPPSAAAATPKFEVASIKPCEGGGFGGRGGGPGSFSPGRITVNCQVLKSLIEQAYLVRADGVTADPQAVLSTPVEGGPAWITSDRYLITAKAEGDASYTMMLGPMLQALLEDRFKLKVHRETREVPVYALTVAKGGAKLKPFQEGSCVPRRPDFTKPIAPPPPLAPGEKGCALLGMRRGPNMVVDAQGIAIDEFSKGFLFTAAERPVIDKTGLTGKFEIHLEYALSEAFRRQVAERQGDPGDPTAPSIFTAVQEQLGLKLESTKGPREFLVIDHVSRPSED